MRLAELVVVLVAVVVLPILALGMRRRVLHRGGGTVDVSLRTRQQGNGRGWILGVGRFEGDALQWYRMFSPSMRPKRTMRRRDLSVVRRREPAGPEKLALPPGAVVLDCKDGARRIELAMEGSAVTGFLAWLEASPPGPAHGS